MVILNLLLFFQKNSRLLDIDNDTVSLTFIQ